MFKLHDNTQAVTGRKREGWNRETKPKVIRQWSHQAPRTGVPDTSLSTWHLHEVTKAKDLLGRNIQVFRRQPKVLWSLHFFQCLYSSFSSCTGKLCPNAVTAIKTEAVVLSNRLTNTHIAQQK